MSKKLRMSLVQPLIEKSKKDKRKGSYSAYEEYKDNLQRLTISGSEYEEAIKIISKNLKV